MPSAWPRRNICNIGANAAAALFPRGFGTDFAGVVEAIGTEVTRLRVGDEVLGGRIIDIDPCPTKLAESAMPGPLLRAVRELTQLGLRGRTEARADLHQGLLEPAYGIVCLTRLRKSFSARLFTEQCFTTDCGEMMVVELPPGTVFAGFTIERLLGAGGMGSVYLAAHPRIPKKIALKFLHRSLTHDPHASVLFEREADHAARLDHPNIVSVLDRGREGDQLWIAMQYVAGTNASEAVARARFEPAKAVHIIGEIAKALDYAHENAVLHRDVKPANMLLEEGGPGRVLLADFGIAKALAETAYRTKSGTLVASLHYAAPEQFEATTLDGRTDVYSLGCSLFHLLTGEPPYPGDSLPQLMHAHLGGRIPAPSWIVADLPVELDRVLARAMAKDRADRYPNCVAFADAAAAAIATSRRRLEPTASLEPTYTYEPTSSQEPATTPLASPSAGAGAVDRQRAGFGRSRKWLAALGVVLVVLVATVLVASQFSSSDANEPPAAAIHSTTMLGADGLEYTVSGSLLDKYSAASTSQKADLGPPLGAEKSNPDGKYQWFVGGVIIQKTGNPAYIVWGEIRNKWNELRGSQGTLGYPTSDEIDVDGVKVSTFENGSIIFKDGIVSVTVG